MTPATVIYGIYDGKPVAIRVDSDGRLITI